MDFERLERALFRASNRNTINRGLTLLKLGRRYAGADGQEHAAYRGVTMNWFLPGRVNQLHEQVRALARQSVDHFLSFDGECDFVKDFALHYPLRVIMSIFGVPPEDEPMMLKLTQDFFGGHDPEEQRAEVVNDPVAAAKMWYASLQDFYSYFDDLSAERRRNPTDDLLSHIAMLS